MPVLPPGTLAPRLTLPDLDGRARDLPLGPACLYFYKIECPTSALVAPVADALARAYGPVCGVAQDGAEEVARFVAGLNLGFPQLLDPPPYAASRRFGIDFTPTAVLIGPDGRVEAVAEGWDREVWNALAAAFADLRGRPSRAISVEGDGLPPRRYG
jgi:hypothetical protein